MSGGACPVLSRARAVRTEHVQGRVPSLLANIPIARPCGKSCAPRDARSQSLSVVVVNSWPLQELPWLKALITARCIPAAALQVVISCDMCFLSQPCGSDVILASSSCLAVYVRRFWSDWILFSS